MSVGRALSSLTAAVAVAGCVALVVTMSRGGASSLPAAAVSTPLSIPALLPGTTLVPLIATPALATAGPLRTTGQPTRSAPSARAALATRTSGPVAHGTASAGAPARSDAAAPAAAPRPTTPAPAPARTTTPPPAPVRGSALPLGFGTGDATRVVTVVAGWAGSTTATLQAWNRAPGGGWLRYGPAVTAHVGADGLSSSPSESRSATPIGSFTLTQAFGAYANPGTGLPYLHTTPADWWISQPGALYNTLQQCSGSCPFTQGSPNEHLYYETPYYDYAVVIDYNTPNAGPVRQGAGSAFFLHVTDGTPTAGCVAIPMANLVPIMRWLTPSAHPRILLGVS